MDEEPAFFLLCTIVEDILPNYYSKSMIGSLIDVKVFDNLVSKYQPKIYAKISEVANTPCFAVTWFMCIFIGCLPWDCTLRALDIVLSFGSRGLFTVGLAVLHTNINEIFDSDPDDLLSFLKNGLKDSLNIDTFNHFLHFYSGILSDKEIEQLRAEQAPIIVSQLETLEVDSVPLNNDYLVDEISEYEQFEIRMNLVKKAFGDDNKSFSQTFAETKKAETFRARAKSSRTRSWTTSRNLPKLRQIAKQTESTGDITSPRTARNSSDLVEEMLDFVSAKQQTRK